MSWPNHFPVSGDPLRNRVAIDSQAFAQMSKAFVVSACGTVDDQMIRMLEPSPEAERFLRDPDCTGGSVIVAPNSRVIAGPLGAEEAILYADCNLELGIQMKLRHDFAGHYNRPDIFQVHVNRAAPRLYRTTDANGTGLPAGHHMPIEAGEAQPALRPPQTLLGSAQSEDKARDDG
jgi:aliphatic nitrilase